MHDRLNERMELEEANQIMTNIKTEIENLIFGQEDLVTETLCTFLSSGHLLITGAPGLDKTTLIKSFSKFLHLKFGRIQFTPDLLPTDITGTEILNIDPETQLRSLQFYKGAIFNVYMHLRNIARPVNGFYLNTGSNQLLSLAPENFFKVKNNIISTYPIKGTIERSEDIMEDK